MVCCRKYLGINHDGSDHSQQSQVECHHSSKKLAILFCKNILCDGMFCSISKSDREIWQLLMDWRSRIKTTVAVSLVQKPWSCFLFSLYSCHQHRFNFSNITRLQEFLMILSWKLSVLWSWYIDTLWVGVWVNCAFVTWTITNEANDWSLSIAYNNSHGSHLTLWSRYKDLFSTQLFLLLLIYDSPSFNENNGPLFFMISSSAKSDGLLL